MYKRQVEKKVPYIDENGTEHKPETPNAYKFETLILDMVYMMDNSPVSYTHLDVYKRQARWLYR